MTRAVRKLFYRIPHDLLLYGEDGHRIALSEGIPRRKLHIIGNSYSQAGSDVQGSGARAAFELPPKTKGRWYVGAIIRLSPVKRLTLLVEAVSILRQRGEDISILLIGEGPSEADLRAQAEQFNVPVHLPGAAYDAGTINEVYKLLDVTVVPEYAGLTTIQSLEHGTPVVTTGDHEAQAPEFRAVLPGRTGALYERGDAESLAQAIERLIRELEENKHLIATHCRQEVENNWSSRAHAERILKAIGLNEFCDTRKRSKRKSS